MRPVTHNFEASLATQKAIMVMASTQSLSCNNTIIRNKKLGFNKVIRPTKDKQGIYTPFLGIHLTLATVEPNLNGNEGN